MRHVPDLISFRALMASELVHYLSVVYLQLAIFWKSHQNLVKIGTTQVHQSSIKHSGNIATVNLEIVLETLELNNVQLT